MVEARANNLLCVDVRCMIVQVGRNCFGELNTEKVAVSHG